MGDCLRCRSMFVRVFVVVVVVVERVFVVSLLVDDDAAVGETWKPKGCEPVMMMMKGQVGRCMLRRGGLRSEGGRARKGESEDWDEREGTREGEEDRDIDLANSIRTSVWVYVVQL